MNRPSCWLITILFILQGIVMRCILCRVSFAQRIKVISHYEDSHGIEIKSENLQFRMEKEYLEWKINVETNTTCKFRKRCCHKNKEHLLILYFCHRSGTYESQAHVRRSKFTGSKKLNGFCPAEIKLYNKKRILDVIFVKTHVGHLIGTEEELSHISYINYDDRKLIASRITARIPMNLEPAVDDDEESIPENTNVFKKHVLNCKDLFDTVLVSEDLVTDRSRIISDVDKFVARNASSILYYKKAGVNYSNCLFFFK